MQHLQGQQYTRHTKRGILSFRDRAAWLITFFVRAWIAACVCVIPTFGFQNCFYQDRPTERIGRHGLFSPIVVVDFAPDIQRGVLVGESGIAYVFANIGIGSIGGEWRQAVWVRGFEFVGRESVFVWFRRGVTKFQAGCNRYGLRECLPVILDLQPYPYRFIPPRSDKNPRYRPSMHSSNV